MTNPSPPSPIPSSLIIYCDGASRGNPGPAAAAFVAVNQDDQVIHQQGKFLNITTNNVAEYQAVILALEWLIEQSNNRTIEQCVINLDSELLYKQIIGKYKIKAPHLKPLMVQIHQLLARLKDQKLDIKFQHQLRSHNHLADSLANHTLDQQAS